MTTGLGDGAADAALWRRWRLDRQAGPGAQMPDPLLLAAYAEGRLSEDEAEPVEAWLADHPWALEDLIAAGEPEAAMAELASEAMILRAAALVPATAGGRGAILPFPPAAARRRQAWRTAIAWGGLAASLLVTSLVGFGIGNNAYDSVDAFTTGQPTAIESAAHELLDPPSAMFDEDEESDT